MTRPELPLPGHLLAQLDAFIAPRIAPLPSPPLIERLVFAAPLMVPIGIAAAAVVAMFVLSSRGKGKLASKVGGLGILLAAAVWAAGALVTSPTEALAERTRAFVAATAAADVDALRDILADSAVIEVPMAPGPFRSLPAGVVLQAGTLAGYLNLAGGIGEHGVPEVQAVIDNQGFARSQASVWVTGRDAGRTGSWWLIDWRADADGVWRAHRITAKWIQGLGD